MPSYAELLLILSGFRFTRQLDRQITQLARIDLGWRVGHQIYPTIIFWERHHVANALFATDEHNQAIEPKRDSAVRRRTEPKGAEQMAKL